MSFDPLYILEKENCTIQEYNLTQETGGSYFHTVVLDNNGLAISGGYGRTSSQSRQVAFAEYLERKQVLRFKEDELLYDDWGFQHISTGCGFAVGFDKNSTELRSLGEAIERWTLSKFIDEQYEMKKVNLSVLNLDKICHWYINQFDEVDFYYKTLLFHHFGEFIQFHVVMSVCKYQNGAFQGSYASTSLDSNFWLHALVESFRHLSIFKNAKIQNLLTFPENKIRYYAQNLNAANSQLLLATKVNWPEPKIKFHKTELIQNGNYIISRTIMDGWKAWNIDGTKRFLY